MEQQVFENTKTIENLKRDLYDIGTMRVTDIELVKHIRKIGFDNEQLKKRIKNLEDRITILEGKHGDN